MNSYFKKSLAIVFFIFFIILSVLNAYANNTVAHVFTPQTSSGFGSNNSQISVDSSLEYVNKGNNSSIVGNYFEGFYYDDIFGYFSVDYLPNKNENVRVVGSTSKCTTGYGYKLGGYAYSEYFGFVDFDYNPDTYVYYCLGDSMLYGYAYSETLGFQNFEGITFPIETQSDITPIQPTSTGTFVNDETEILSEETPPNGFIPSNNSQNSNFNPNTIQNDVFEFEVDRESLFYIIK